MMGCTAEQGDDCEDNEKPAHEVTVSSFNMGKYEVTKAQWEAVMGSNPSSLTGCADCPVETVTWQEVQQFISKLNRLTGKRYRLPTEAEWEYAARGGNKSKGYKYAGSNSARSAGWYGNEKIDNKTHEVGGKLPNELGLYDMSGNVEEWCGDWYREDYYKESSSIDPQGPIEGEWRVVRGGHWHFYADQCRVSHRSSAPPDFLVPDMMALVGFRLALDE